MSNLDSKSFSRNRYNTYVGNKLVRAVTPWEKRIAATPTNYTAECPDAGSHSAEMTLTFVSPSGHEYELDCVVFAEYEPAQRGGWEDPSWDAYFYSAVAYWFRPGHGWRMVDLTESQEEMICDHFASDDGGYDGPEPDYDYGHHYDY